MGVWHVKGFALITPTRFENFWKQVKCTHSIHVFENLLFAIQYMMMMMMMMTVLCEAENVYIYSIHNFSHFAIYLYQNLLKLVEI